MLAPAVVLLALAEQRIAIAATLVYALLADIADGKLARRMGVATARLRQADSGADVVFWSSVLVAACLLEPEGMRVRALWIVLVVALEVAVNATSFVRFGRAPANHAYAAKLWGLVMCASLVAIVGVGHFGLLFGLAIGAGVIAGLDGIAILALLPAWKSDVPSAFSARRMRREQSGGR